MKSAPPTRSAEAIARTGGRERSLSSGLQLARRRVAAGAHAGARRSRKARSPSCPSSLVRRSAMRRAVSGPSGRSSTSRFAWRAARGPAVRSSPSTRSRAAPRSSATSCTSPIASAVAASKRSPVTKYRRAALSPIFRSANGEMTAGMIPSFTSENANTARGSAITMSLHATSPMPPPSAWPWTSATTGAGQPSIASNIRRSAFASATFASRSRSAEARIHSTSAPAQKLGPSPASTTARQVPTSTNASESSAIRAADRTRCASRAARA